MSEETQDREVDNFELIRNHLTFVPVEERWLDKDGKQKSELRHYDRYVIHILRRPKDCKELANELGSNESQRLIKTYFIDNLEYFDKKIPAIKELCRANNARAYILLQVRNTRDCLLNLNNKITEVLLKKNYGIKPERLLRQAYCEFHSSRKPVWMLDIDNDQMYGWSKEEILSVLDGNLRSCGKDPSSTYVVSTRNGFHIITEPFNTLKAASDCPMIFEEHKKGYSFELVNKFFTEVLNSSQAYPETVFGVLKTNPFQVKETEDAFIESCKDPAMLDKFRKECKVDIAGWLHKDAATLLYAP